LLESILSKEELKDLSVFDFGKNKSCPDKEHFLF